MLVLSLISRLPYDPNGIIVGHDAKKGANVALLHCYIM